MNGEIIVCHPDAENAAGYIARNTASVSIYQLFLHHTPLNSPPPPPAKNMTGTLFVARLVLFIISQKRSQNSRVLQF